MTKQAKQTLQYVLDNGVMRGDRTGKGRHSVFSPPDEIYDLSKGLPLSTLRRVSPKAMVDELLWFISGSTKVEDLASRFFWDRWTPGMDDLEKYCEAAGLHFEKSTTNLHWTGSGDKAADIVEFTAPPEVVKRLGTIGNLYGVSWRNAPAPEGNLLPIRKMSDLPKALVAKFSNEDVEGVPKISVAELIRWLDADDGEDEFHVAEIKATVRGQILAEYWKTYDQLNELVYKIKTTPFSSRLRVSAYLTNYMAFEEFTPQENVMDGRACLTPCHTFFQCYVSESPDGSPAKLDLKLTLTSSDVPVGRVYNVAQYALLTHMLAQVCGLTPGRLIISTGDVHIYGDQFEAVDEILSREPLKMPTLWLNSEVKDIFAFTPDDIRIENYEAHPPVKVPVAV